jgi:hypothetical protein
MKQKNAQTGRRDVVSKGPWPKPDVIKVFKSPKKYKKSVMRLTKR